MKEKDVIVQENAMSYEVLLRALFENYESIYAVDAETFEYRCYHESESFRELKIERSGTDFFGNLRKNIRKTVCPDDQDYVIEKLSRDAVLEGLKKEKYYSLVHRLMVDGRPVYHKVRATADTIGGRPYILIGVRNVDEAFRQDKERAEQVDLLQQKEKNHLEAIMSSAAGYLEANLTQDILLEMSTHLKLDMSPLGTVGEDPHRPLRYSDMRRLVFERHAVQGAKQYLAISDREYLIKCFERGEKRASVSFSYLGDGGEPQPCKEVFYLYRDEGSGDIMSFCVIYDLTEQQRKEKELEELEDALRMSRIKNFTSQMQPHFLYNALASIQEIVLDDPEYASQLIGDFTVHLRSCIRAMASDAPLPFEQELSNIHAYVNIEKMRFGKKLNVLYDVAAVDFGIIPLSIQPLVENAIRHGIYQRGSAGGTVAVRSRELPDRWVVTVEDDGVGFDTEAFFKESASGGRDSTGLNNIIFRLDKVMGAKVDVHSTVGVGTSVTVSIPKKEETK